MSFHDNVLALATELGISIDPELREEDVRVNEVFFIDEYEDLDGIFPSITNRAERLFFQQFLSTNNEVEINIDDALRDKAVTYFSGYKTAVPEAAEEILKLFSTSPTVRILRKCTIEIPSESLDFAFKHGGLRYENHKMILDLSLLEVLRVEGTTKTLLVEEPE